RGELQRPGATAVEELQRSDIGEDISDLGSTREQIGTRARLHSTDHRSIRAVVALTGDLRLIHLETHEAESRAAGDHAREAGDVTRGEQRRASHADVAERGGTPRRIRIDRDADRFALAGGRDAVDEIEV